MRRWRETVEVCLGVTGLRGAFSRRVVSEARRVLRPLWFAVFNPRPRASDTRIRTGTCVCFLNTDPAINAGKKTRHYASDGNIMPPQCVISDSMPV